MSFRLFMAHVAMFMVALFYAANFSWAKLVMPDYVGAFGFILLRVAAATFLFFVSSLFIKNNKIERADIGLIALSGFFGVSFNMLTFFKGLELTTPLNGALIMLTTPILVLVFSIVALKEKLSAIRIVGVIMGLGAALYLILNSGNNSSLSAPDPMLGNILVTLNAASYGIYLIMIKPLTKKYHPVVLLTWTFGFGLIMVFPFGIQQVMLVEWGTMPAHIYWVIAFVLFCVTFLAYLLNGAALTVVSPAVVGAYIYLQPLLTALIAVAGGFDKLSFELIVSAILIFGALYLVSRK